MIKILKAAEYKAAAKKHAEARAGAGAPEAVTATVLEVIRAVRERGDDALREYTEKFDGCAVGSLELPAAAIDAAMEKAGPKLVGALRRAAENIERFHKNQARPGFEFSPGDGIVLGQRIMPLERVGIYVPGGTAAYPSCLLMSCIPARLAGVGEIILATPPSADGSVSAAILAAAGIAGVDRVFTVGGAQAIAAMAFGTQSIPRTDKIVGAGNAYVAEAKRQVFGAVGIDMIAGPSDILVIADHSADPVLVAADMLSQCEHGADSAAVLVTDSQTLAHSVRDEIEAQLEELPRKDIARASIENNGVIIITEIMGQAFEIANEIAPEHLEICLDDPFSYLHLVRNAGSVFLGKDTPEALGDYYAGPNNTLPTWGTARFAGPLSVDDFVKKSSYAYYAREALEKAGDDILLLAGEEGLKAHALSVSRRLSAPEGGGGE